MKRLLIAIFILISIGLAYGSDLSEVIRAGKIDGVRVVDKAELKTRAETEGYGYKTTNLEKLEALSEKLNEILGGAGSKYKIGIPAFVGISSATIKDFLKTNGVDVASKWATLMDKYFPVAQRNKDNAIFQTKKFPDGFLEDVKSTFVGPITQAFGNELNLSDEKKEALNKIIKGASEKDKRLMVRSTGKEDTEKLANAGGNETKANVIPDMPNVMQAMKEVVLSYFGEKSLIQRLGGGDETLFEEPMTPILVQQMVGEKPGGETDLQKVTRCGVMFTEEPEGGLSKMHPEDKSKTSGIAIIQASYGHNEGVVNSIVAVDTYYVDALGNMFPVIRPKLFRIIPLADGGKLGRSERHADSWSYVPALNNEEVQVLKLLANALEQYYQGPMDVEYVVDRADKKIWIVQARPIVHNPNQPKPSYLKDSNISNKITGEAIGVAGGKLRVVANEKQCIVRKTIGEALEVYQDVATDRNMVECIVIGQYAPATSHEATTFRGELKPVIFTKDWEKVEALVKEGKKVVVDVQQGIIAPFEGGEEELNALVVDGWVSYPIAAKMSLWRKEVDALKVVTELNVLRKMAKEQGRKIDKSLEKQMQFVWQNMVFLGNCTAQLASISAERKESHGLLYKQFDKAVKKQHIELGKIGEIVNGYSLATLLKELKADKSAAELLGAETKDERIVQLIKLGGTALTGALGDLWANFVKDKFATSSDDERNKFSQFIHALGELNTLEIWLHSVFVRSATAPGGCSVESLLADGWDDATKEFLKLLAEKKKMFKQIDVRGVADPSKFEKVWKDFCDNTVSYFIGDFVSGFETAKDTGKLAALQVMKDFIEVFDGALKEMSRSNMYQIFTDTPAATESDRIKKDKDKGFVFKVMLKKNLDVLRAWWDLLCKMDAGSEEKMQYEVTSVSDALSIVRELFDGSKLGTKATDFQSLSYNVAEGVIGSRARFGRAMPKTLENIFTFIHQSQLVIVGALNGMVGLNLLIDIAIPAELKQIHDVILMVKKNDYYKVTLLGSSLEKGVLRLFYNWPQRNHSSLITVTYFHATKKIDVKISFVGLNERARWELIADMLKMKSNCEAYVQTRGVDIVWHLHIADFEQIELIKKMMVHASLLSFANCDYFGWYQSLYTDEQVVNKLAVLNHCGFLCIKNMPDFLKPETEATFQKIIDRFLRDKVYQLNTMRFMWQMTVIEEILFDPFSGGMADVLQQYFIKNVRKIMTGMGKPSIAERQAYFDNAIIQPENWCNDIMAVIFVPDNQDNIKENIEHMNELQKRSLCRIALRAMSIDESWLFDFLRNNQNGNISVLLAREAERQDYAPGINGKRVSSVDLWCALVEKGFGLDEAIAAAKQSGSTYLFKALFKKGRGFGEAFELAKKLSTSDKNNFRMAALELWKILIEAGYEPAYADAIDAVKVETKSVKYDRFSHRLYDEVFTLWTALFKNGKGIDEARGILPDIIDENVRSKLTKLLDQYSK